MVNYGATGLGRPRSRRTAYKGYVVGYGGAVAGDYDWITADSQVALHLRGEDGNGADPTDSGYYLHTVTVNELGAGDAECSTTNAKFGSGSLKLAGSADYFSVPAHSIFESTSSDKTTWEMWFNSDTLGNDDQFLEISADSSNYFRISWVDAGGGSGYVRVRMYVGGVFKFQLVGTTVTTADYELSWQHLRVTRDGTSFTLYVNGTQEATTTSSETIPSTWDVYVGGNASGGWYDGYIDEVLIIDGATPSGAGVPTTAFTPVTSFNIHESTANMVAWYKFEEGSGTSIADSSANTNTATASGGMTWPTGKVGSYAGGFDGTNDYAAVTYHASLDVTDITYCCWAKRNDTNDEIFFIKPFNAGWSSDYTFQTSGGKFNARTYGGTGQVLASATYTTGQWYHLAATWTGTTLEFFVNGVSQGTDVTAGTIQNAAFPIYMGLTNAVYCDCELDDVRIYDRVLTDTEIQEIYNYGA